MTFNDLEEKLKVTKTLGYMNFYLVDGEAIRARLVSYFFIKL